MNAALPLGDANSSVWVRPPDLGNFSTMRLYSPPEASSAMPMLLPLKASRPAMRAVTSPTRDS